MSEQPIKVPAVILALHRLTLSLSRDFLGGPKVLKLAWVINFQKGTTLLFVGLLMVIYQNYSTVAWIYLGLHGSYGLVWLIKHATFPDKRWNVPVTVGGALLSFLLVLGPYWLAPYLLISGILGPDHPQPGNSLIWLAISLHSLGLAVMVVADSQKFYTLKYHPGLITEGIFRYIRHPNYLGEMLIYISYALLVQHWLPWLVLLWVWGVVFSVNIWLKEASLARFSGWEQYKARSGLLLPKLPWFNPKPVEQREKSRPREG